MINEVTAVGDGSVTANFAVTLPCFQWFHRLETKVSKP